MTAMARTTSVKDTAFGQDMLEVLAERQLEKISFRELDTSCSIVTLKGYLRLAADIDNRIAKLKLRYKATGDMKIYYDIQELKKIRQEHRDTAWNLLCRGERRKHEKIKEDTL